MIFSNLNYRSDQLLTGLESKFALGEMFLLAEVFLKVYDFKMSILCAYDSDSVAITIKNLSRKFCKPSSEISANLINYQTDCNCSKFEKVIIHTKKRRNFYGIKFMHLHPYL